MNIITKFPIGQYVDGNKSWLRIIDSRLKMIAVLIFLITPIWAGPIWRLSLVCCLILITFKFFTLSSMVAIVRFPLFFIFISRIISILASDIQSLAVLLEILKNWK